MANPNPDPKPFRTLHEVSGVHLDDFAIAPKDYIDWMRRTGRALMLGDERGVVAALALGDDQSPEVADPAELIRDPRGVLARVAASGSTRTVSGDERDDRWITIAATASDLRAFNASRQPETVRTAKRAKELVPLDVKAEHLRAQRRARARELAAEMRSLPRREAAERITEATRKRATEPVKTAKLAADIAATELRLVAIKARELASPEYREQRRQRVEQHLPVLTGVPERRGPSPGRVVARPLELV
jgi:hypothetical protein